MSDLPPSNEPPAAAHAFDCPLCGGAFEVDAEWLGQAIPCPHCGGDVELPAPASTEAAAIAERPPADDSRSAATPPANDPPRKLTPAERAALRRRVNLTLAVIGLLLLAVMFVVLAGAG